MQLLARSRLRLTPSIVCAEFLDALLGYMPEPRFSGSIVGWYVLGS